MYKLYTDVEKKFTCKVDVGGASLNECKARIILETESINLLFNGNISNDGICEIPINKLKDYLKENQNGEIRLEIIAENTVFNPWNDKFIVETKKKVSVTEIKDVEETSSSVNKISESNINVSVKVDNDYQNNNVVENTHLRLLKEQIKKRNVSTMDEFNSILSTYFSILNKKNIKLSEDVKTSIRKKLKKEVK